MKKMIMAAAIVCAAAIAQASAVTWGMMAGKSLDSEKFANGTAYLICVDALAKPAFADDAAAKTWFDTNGASLEDKALFNQTVSAGFAAETVQHDVAIGRKNYYMIVVNGDKSAMAITSGAKAINITTSAMGVSASWDATTAMATYDLVSVPEPTSGLLLLLGMAGLALKRKHA